MQNCCVVRCHNLHQAGKSLTGCRHYHFFNHITTAVKYQRSDILTKLLYRPIGQKKELCNTTTNKKLKHLQRIGNAAVLSDENRIGLGAITASFAGCAKTTLHCTGPNDVGSSVSLELLAFTVTTDLISLRSFCVSVWISSAPGCSIIMVISSWRMLLLVWYFNEHVSATDSPSTTLLAVAFINISGFDSAHTKKTLWQALLLQAFSSLLSRTIGWTGTRKLHHSGFCWSRDDGWHWSYHIQIICISL